MKQRITDEQVDQIIRMLRNTWMPFKTIASRVGIGYDMVGNINYGRSNWIKRYGDGKLEFPIRMTIEERNEEIYRRYEAGVPIETLMEDYELGASSTRKIYYKVRKQKNKNK